MGVLVLHKDMRAVGYCNRGGRLVMQRVTAHTGVSWRDFLLNGIDSDLLVGLDDAIIQSVVKKAKQRVASEVTNDG